MRDPYLVLGVSKSASADEIKGTYRKLAKKYHPDVNQGRKDIEQKFKEITAAYDFLSDADRRSKYDRGEIDADGSPRGFGGGGYSAGRGSNGGGRTRSGQDPFANFSNMDDIFAEFMGGQGARRAGAASGKGADATYTLTLPFAEACLGGKRRVTLTNGKTIDVTVPAGVDDGYKMRLRGQGDDGPRGSGDAIIEIHIEPHPDFTRKEKDIYQEVSVSLPEAVLGATIEVPTLSGSVMLKVPAGANTGTTLRLKGKGVASGKSEAGDMLIRLRVMLPEKITTDMVEFLEKWNKKNAYNPRKK